ncbi:hypothetical protein BD413DRAFT_613853 [Trametes elegans]|nr:hypothetical protein BD413DRAFT_613853 [Trametes elegans]
MHFDLDGVTVTFDKTLVPDLPAIGFADDISRLFQEWHKSDLLVVNGYGIPVKHWNWFYQKKTHIKGHAWDSIVEERERFATEQEFWEKYSDNEGKHLNQQTILALIRGTRGQSDRSDADAALDFFKNDLSHPSARGYFQYKKRNIVVAADSMPTLWASLLLVLLKPTMSFCYLIYGKSRFPFQLTDWHPLLYTP